MRDPQHEPERRCIMTGERGPASGLIRLALGPDNLVLPDVRARAPGRIRPRTTSLTRRVTVFMANRRSNAQAGV